MVSILLSFLYGALVGVLFSVMWRANPSFRLRDFKIKHAEYLQWEKIKNEEMEMMLDAERKRISGELHDDMLQRMSSIRLSLLHTMSRYTLPVEVNQQVDELAGDMNEAMQSTKYLIWDLVLPEIKQKSLNALMQELCQMADRNASLKISFISVMEEWERPLSNEMKKEIYRMVQEAVHNAIKYSNGWHIDVSLQWHHQHLSITIADNGEGIQAQRGEGYGMGNMRIRALRINARLEIFKNNPRGTVVKVELPYSSLV